MTGDDWTCVRCWPPRRFPVASLKRDHDAREHAEEVTPDDNDQPDSAAPRRA